MSVCRERLLANRNPNLDFRSGCLSFESLCQMKRIFVIGYAALLFASISYTQESTPAPPALEPQAPQRPRPWRSSPPAQEVVPVPVPIAPPKPNVPVQKSLVRITATSVEPDYRAP